MDWVIKSQWLADGSGAPVGSGVGGIAVELGKAVGMRVRVTVTVGDGVWARTVAVRSIAAIRVASSAWTGFRVGPGVSVGCVGVCVAGGIFDVGETGVEHAARINNMAIRRVLDDSGLENFTGDPYLLMEKSTRACFRSDRIFRDEYLQYGM
jgi:hypothetical protein